MKILVIDDNPRHQASARQTLTGHDVIIATTYDEAQARLYKYSRNADFPCLKFDAVLTDLLMPASKMTMGPEGLKYVGQEVPAGFALSLLAVLNGAKYVAVERQQTIMTTLRSQ